MKHKIYDVFRNKKTGKNKILIRFKFELISGNQTITYGFQDGSTLKNEQIEVLEKIEDPDQVNKISMELLSDKFIVKNKPDWL